MEWEKGRLIERNWTTPGELKLSHAHERKKKCTIGDYVKDRQILMLFIPDVEA